jgi:hypothetical protein
MAQARAELAASLVAEAANRFESSTARLEQSNFFRGSSAILIAVQ